MTSASVIGVNKISTTSLDSITVKSGSSDAQESKIKRILEFLEAPKKLGTKDLHEQVSLPHASGDPASTNWLSLKCQAVSRHPACCRTSKRLGKNCSTLDLGDEVPDY